MTDAKKISQLSQLSAEYSPDDNDIFPVVTETDSTPATKGFLWSRLLWALNRALDGKTWTASTDPTANDDQNSEDMAFAPGDIWVNTADDKAFICLDASPSAAVWTEITDKGTTVLIEDIELSASASEIVFSNIPQTYDDLYLLIEMRTDKSATADAIHIVFNNDTGSNYSTDVVWIYGNGSIGGSETINAAYLRNLWACAANSPTGDFATYTMRIHSYNSTAKNKNGQSRGQQRTTNNAGNNYLYDATFSWHPSTPTPITSIKFTSEAGANFVAGTRITLYGIKRA